MTLRRIIPAIFALVAPAMAAAHPHIFVDTGLRLATDEGGRLSGVEVAWEYDELYSLLVLEDMELDDDYDGKLKPEEMARLDGFDQHWVEGYAGDLYLSGEGGTVRLGPPENRGTSFENGRITTRHFRAIEGAGTGPWEIRAYDPTFYTAYDLTRGIATPAGCEARVVAADLDAAQLALQAELAKIPADAESDYPEVGEIFADRIVVTCRAGS